MNEKDVDEEKAHSVEKGKEEKKIDVGGLEIEIEVEKEVEKEVEMSGRGRGPLKVRIHTPILT